MIRQFDRAPYADLEGMEDALEAAGKLLDPADEHYQRRSYICELLEARINIGVQAKEIEANNQAIGQLAREVEELKKANRLLIESVGLLMGQYNGNDPRQLKAAHMAVVSPISQSSILQPVCMERDRAIQ